MRGRSRANPRGREEGGVRRGSRREWRKGSSFLLADWIFGRDELREESTVQPAGRRREGREDNCLLPQGRKGEGRERGGITAASSPQVGGGRGGKAAA